jgi:hypothetical protein
VSPCDYCWSIFTLAIESLSAIEGSQWSGSVTCAPRNQRRPEEVGPRSTAMLMIRYVYIR